MNCLLCIIQFLHTPQGVNEYKYLMTVLAGSRPELEILLILTCSSVSVPRKLAPIKHMHSQLLQNSLTTTVYNVPQYKQRKTYVDVVHFKKNLLTKLLAKISTV